MGNVLLISRNRLEYFYQCILQVQVFDLYLVRQRSQWDYFSCNKIVEHQGHPISL